MQTGVRIVEYTPAYHTAFKMLNELWIKKYFELEEEDIKTLNHPDQIITDGGQIFVALIGSKAVGVCALRKKTADTFEFSKMAVAEEVQGSGIGRKLAEAAISKAKERGSKRIYLEGNTLLEASIHLYKKLGFQEILGQQSPYQRVNIIMELLL